MSQDQDMFTFTGTGTLKRIDTFTTKAGKSILTLIFETDGQYPQTIPIKVFGRLADEAPDWTPGSLLSIRGRLGGREWNGKVYGEMIATRVDVQRKETRQQSLPASGSDEPPPPSDDDVPF